MQQTSWSSRQIAMAIVLVVYVVWFGYGFVRNMLAASYLGLEPIPPVIVGLVAAFGLYRLLRGKHPAVEFSAPLVALFFVAEVAVLISLLMSPSASALTQGPTIMLIGWLAGAGAITFWLLILWAASRILEPSRPPAAPAHPRVQVP